MSSTSSSLSCLFDEISSLLCFFLPLMSSSCSVWPSHHKVISPFGYFPYIYRVSFRIFVKGGGGKRDNSRVKGGGKDYSMFFYLWRMTCSLTSYYIRGVWGYAPPGKFFNVSTSETVSGGFWALRWGKSVSNIHWFPSISSQMLQGCGICLLPRVARSFS